MIYISFLLYKKIFFSTDILIILKPLVHVFSIFVLFLQDFSQIILLEITSLDILSFVIY